VSLTAPPTSLPPVNRGPGRHRQGSHASYRWFLVILVALVAGVVVWRGGLLDSVFGSKTALAPTGPTGGAQPSGPSTIGSPPPLPTPSETPGPINTSFPGLTTFRGNATRDYYGEGPLPNDPEILWRYPSSGGLCSSSSDNHGTRVWCGTGWTGQPNVIERKNGVLELRFGAYDGHYHFLNGKTGQPLRPALITGDLAKGSATSDAEGYPLYYAGSRDNHLRVVALDRAAPTVLWSVDANTSAPNPVWNDDWDGAPLEIGDYLLEGGENSWFYVIRLHRHYDEGGLVQVDPKIVMLVPGYDDQLRRDVHDDDISIENSVAFDAKRGVAYFSNSGGLVQGWDISDILKGGTHYRRVFRFWAGDAVDASIVIDPEGYLYVGRHVEANVPRPNPLAGSLGSLIKLDPRKPSDPVVWSAFIGSSSPDGGILSTPALYHGRVYVTDTSGGLVAVNQHTGKILYEIDLPGPTWMSPVPIDDQLLVGDCSGVLHDYDIAKRKRPKELWHVQLEGCVESTPAVWHGMIWVGARGGAMYGIGDPS
jgi:outer membrane protein assembly factor BamB